MALYLHVIITLNGSRNLNRKNEAEQFDDISFNFIWLFLV